MSKIEYISPEGLRIDGRRVGELRRIKGTIGSLEGSDGSSYLEIGNTKVLAAVYGPREVRNKSKVLHDRAVINCEFSMATFSTGERRKKSKGDKRSIAVARVLDETFNNVVMTQQFPRSQIDIYLQVLQADGGISSACINAATLALIDAGIPMKDYVTSISAGCITGKPLIDINYIEESAGGPELTVAILPKSKKIIMLEMESRVHADAFEDILKLAMEGCQSIHSILDKIVKDKTKERVLARGL